MEGKNDQKDLRLLHSMKNSVVNLPQSEYVNNIPVKNMKKSDFVENVLHKNCHRVFTDL